MCDKVVLLLVCTGAGSQCIRSHSLVGISCVSCHQGFDTVLREVHSAYKNLLQLLQSLSFWDPAETRVIVEKKGGQTRTGKESFNSCHSSLAHSVVPGKVTIVQN